MRLLDPDFLAKGSERQRQVFQTLTALGLPENLSTHAPVLAGDIPLAVDIETSPLEIICSTPDLVSFAKQVTDLFGREDGFELHHKLKRSLPAVSARFRRDSIQFEIIAQSDSVFLNPSVILMLVEARLLSFAPAEARDRIRSLKQTGMRTEAAFADCFAISEDPSEALLKLAKLPDHELLMVAHEFRWRHQ